jgi:Domain of unknown function (DUF4783)
MKKGKRGNRGIGILFLLLSILFIAGKGSAQEEKGNEAMRIFALTEDGLGTGAVDKFSSNFSERCYLSLKNGISGYYSSNQAYYVLKDFLSIYQPVSFRLNNIVAETTMPFASGTFKFISRGIRGTSNIFISLQRFENHYCISQITIN